MIKTESNEGHITFMPGNDSKCRENYTCTTTAAVACWLHTQMNSSARILTTINDIGHKSDILSTKYDHNYGGQVNNMAA